MNTQSLMDHYNKNVCTRCVHEQEGEKCPLFDTMLEVYNVSGKTESRLDALFSIYGSWHDEREVCLMFKKARIVYE